jgi:hypothetical protein
MSRAIRGICAVGWVLFILAGCNSAGTFNLLAWQSPANGGERVVAGSVESVSQTTQATLRELGLAAVVTNQGGVVTITSTSPTGARFDVVLSQEKTKDGERTRVRLKWDGASDDQTGTHLFSRLEFQSGH